MEDAINFTKENSAVMAFRVLKTDKKRIENAAKKTAQRPGVFMRIGVLNEVKFIEDQE